MNKTIVITGASGAIGSMVAYKAALKKYNIVMTCHHNMERLQSLATQLESFGAKALCLQGDITKAAHRREIVDAAVNTFGGIDVLINNAGDCGYGLLNEMEDETISALLGVDLTAQILLTKQVLGTMYSRHSGSIVNVSSVWGVAGAAGETVYSAAKAGMIGFTKALAKEAAGGGVRVNAVAPGAVHSRMTAHLSKEELELLEKEIPLGRLGDALEIAESILFIAEHNYTTGQVFSPNGGLII